MIEIRRLDRLDPSEFPRLIGGYVSDARYRVTRTESDHGWVLALEEVPRVPPYQKRYDHLTAATIADYQRVLARGFSLAAYDDTECVGLAIADVSPWNLTLRVHELHVAPTHQRCGIGHKLVQALEMTGRKARLRVLLCETQNTNVPAIRFYRKMGFALEGLDLSHYCSTDYPDGEIALYMKKPLGT